MILLSILAAAAAPALDPGEIVCRTHEVPGSIGSRIKQKVKVCKTREEWRNERQFSGLPADTRS